LHHATIGHPATTGVYRPAGRHDKESGETRTDRRWLAAHGRPYHLLQPVYFGDDLFSRRPICEAVLETVGHFNLRPQTGFASGD
jgi:hypothetical protein